MKRLLIVGLMLAAGACEQVENAAEEAGESLVELTVSAIGSLARQITDDPAQAEALLESSGVSVEQLDSILYEIATDPQARSAYLEAMTAGSTN